jgi:nucleotide-binding universal stress UspA family protein
MFTHILVPTDGSELSAKAIVAALTLAKTLGARITGYACLEPYPYAPMSEFSVETPALFSERIENQANANLESFVHTAKQMGVEAETYATEASAPYQGIIDAAKALKCDVIFMSSHGRRGLAGLLLGSETQKVLTHSDIPVLVFR